MNSTTNNNELITIGVCLYNMEKTINQAIDNCLNQTYKNTEILVVDDASTDNSVKIIEETYKKELESGKIRLYKRQKNGGISHTLYDITEKAKGVYIVFFDPDDIHYPTRVEKQYNAIKEAEKLHPNQMVGCFCSADINYLDKKAKHILGEKINVYTQGGGSGLCMYKIEDLKKMGNWEKEKLIRGADTDMYIKMLKNKCYFVYLEEPLLQYNFIYTKQKKKIEEKKNADYFNEIRKEWKNKYKSTGNFFLDIFYKIKKIQWKIKILFLTIIVKYEDSSHYFYKLFNKITILKIKIYKKNNYIEYVFKLFGLIFVGTFCDYKNNISTKQTKPTNI